MSLNECIADRFACLAERGGVMGRGGALSNEPRLSLGELTAQCHSLFSNASSLF